MLDAAGRELKLGDKVLVTGGTERQSMIKGELIRFTPKGCKVRLDVNRHPWRGGEFEEVLRHEHQVALIEHDPDREAELSAPQEVKV